MEAEQAMQEYISCVNVLDPEGSQRVIRLLLLCTTLCNFVYSESSDIVDSKTKQSVKKL